MDSGLKCLKIEREQYIDVTRRKTKRNGNKAQSSAVANVKADLQNKAWKIGLNATGGGGSNLGFSRAVSVSSRIKTAF